MKIFLVLGYITTYRTAVDLKLLLEILSETQKLNGKQDEMSANMSSEFAQLRIILSELSTPKNSAKAAGFFLTFLATSLSMIFIESICAYY